MKKNKPAQKKSAKATTPQKPLKAAAPNANFEKAKEISKSAELLSGISSLIAWDQETYMPDGGAGIRAEQLQTLAGIIHKERTGSKFTTALKKLVDIKTGKVKEKGLTDQQKAAVREWRRDYIKATALPSRFVEDFAKLTSQSLQVWRFAKQDNCFSHFAPYLDKIVSMSRKKADLLGYKDHPYDALLDIYEPGTTTAQVSELFTSTRKAITTLLAKITKAKQVDDSFLFAKIPQEKQLEMGNQILHAMGYDFAKGRLDISSHPFSSACHPTDSRITTRIHPTSVMSNLFVILHEAGHALYEMGLPVEHYGTPLCHAISLGMHESQSRWWETRIGQTKAFWQHFLPKVQAQFKGKLQSVTLDNFYRAINKVEPSMIRVEADEVTYPLHVILRFELEKALIEGKLKVRDLPEAWNAKMQDLLGITPKTNAEGCLQDIHWSMGAFGYFPTYTLGTMYASHFFPAFEKAFPNWEKRVAEGDLLFIKDWLTQNVHCHGREFSSQDLILNVTGKPFTSKAFIDYLNKKYSEIYKF